MINRTPLDYDFMAARRCLQAFTDEMTTGKAEKEWYELLIFGSYDYAEGGGAHPMLGIRRTDGAVFGLDLDMEADKAMFSINSSAARFIRSFNILHEFLGNARQLPPDIEECMRKIDPEVYPESDWHDLIAFVNDPLA